MNYRQQLIRHYGSGEGNALYRHIMEECFALSQTDILLGKDSDFSAKDELRLQEITLRLLKNEPIQYILGQCRFLGHTFCVHQGALIPRPETEQLVTMLSKELEGERACILDIGTGTGCIAVSLALLGHVVTAMDISPEALDIARENARKLGTEVEFLHEDILNPRQTARKWDAIISNPPYVMDHEKAEMQDNVLQYEPENALFVPDCDPLLFYKAIADFGQKHLNARGRLYFEINHKLARETANVLDSRGYTDIKITKDQYEKERFVTAYLE